jgi:hypothetical protein
LTLTMQILLSGAAQVTNSFVPSAESVKPVGGNGMAMDEIFRLATSKHKTWFAEVQAMYRVLSVAATAVGERYFGPTDAVQIVVQPASTKHIINRII